MTLPDGSVVIFDVGTPQYWIERRISPRLQFADYESWRSYNCHYWPITPEGQEEARRRTEAMWAPNPKPYWSMLHPPFYYSGYFNVDDGNRRTHAEYQERFREERRALGDIVILRTRPRLRGVADPAGEIVIGTIFAIGTPQRIIDLEGGPPPDLSADAILPSQFLPV